MNSTLFESERQDVEAILASSGQHLQIPSPGDPEYLTIFMALQRSHPALAARLVRAEQADPEDLLPNIPPKPSKLTFRHRLNSFANKHFMRPGIDGRPVANRNRIVKTALYSAGALAVGALVWSVASPSPQTTVKAAPTVPAETIAAAGPKQATDPAPPETPSKVEGAAGPGTYPPAGAMPAEDSAPTPVTATDPSSSPLPSKPQTQTPAPPAVFREVPSSPVPVVSSGSDLPTPLPLQDSRPAPITLTDRTPSRAVTPLSSAPPFELPSAAPVTVAAPAVRAASTSELPLFGEGESMPVPDQTIPALSSPKAQTSDLASRRGQALIYQQQAETSTLPSALEHASALVYQAPDAPASSLVSSSDRPSSALIYQQARPSAPSAAEQPLVSESEAAPGLPAAVPTTPDPDAPNFAPTTLINGKLYGAVQAAAGMNVLVMVLSPVGIWVGTASYNTALGRVDMVFQSLVNLKNRKSYPVQALGYQTTKGQLRQGVMANVHPIAPTLPLDLARTALNSFNSYTQALGNSGTTSVSGSLVTTSKTAPDLSQVVRGEIGKVFALPAGTQSITVVAEVADGTPIQVVYGVGASQDTGQSP
jgi:hypothetical protein